MHMESTRQFCFRFFHTLLHHEVDNRQFCFRFNTPSKLQRLPDDPFSHTHHPTCTDESYFDPTKFSLLNENTWRL
jgi:hypothetical protein